MLTKQFIQDYFHADFKSTDSLLNEILIPIFGDYEKGYTEITLDTPKAQEMARAAHILTIKHIATLQALAFDIKVFDVTLDEHCHIHQARKGIQALVRQFVDRFEGAFIVFHYANPANRSWRLSYLEKRSTNAASTNAKRYTYLCGQQYPCRTIAERFDVLQKDEKTAVNLEKAFSVETLSDEFFNEYRYFYDDFVNFVTNEDSLIDQFNSLAENNQEKASKMVRDYIKKLMGRLVFIQFLQNKGWLNNDIHYTHTLFDTCTDSQKDNFLDNVLEPLFFGVFNTPKAERETIFQQEGWGSDLYNRWKDFPYLNGGLFERDELDQLKLPIPSYFFSNPEHKDIIRKPTDKYYDDSCGIFDFFDRYNFTIDESDPLDNEVGVDPEMLGKIFENLLEDNKDKGAFYTPKEIVQYMCKEALIAYLIDEARRKSEVNKQRQSNFEDAIRAFVNDPEMTVIRMQKYGNQQLKDLNESLCEVKICDPAIGSGAFPMGLLNLLMNCRVALNNALGIGQPRDWMKKEIIQNNIYGVDIEKGAIDIARLRFWLSIVVDLEEPEALPNFDYKFMQGNSLLEQYQGVDLSTLTQSKKEQHEALQVSMFDDQLDVLRKTLRTHLDDYFLTTDHQIKTRLRQQIKDNVNQQLHEQHIRVDFPEQYDIAANTDFFLWHTWFADVFNRPSKQGFDIVIGNPPYVSSKELKNEDKALYRKYYVAANNQMDLYALFIELASKLLRPNAVSSYIVPDSLIGRSNFETTRKLIISENTILKWVHLNEVFKSANVASVIYVLKNKTLPDYSFTYVKSENVRNWKNNIVESVEIKKSIVNKTAYCKVNFSSDIENSLIFKINENEQLQSIMIMWRGEEMGRRSTAIKYTQELNCLPLLAGDNVHRYEPIDWSRFIAKKDVNKSNYNKPKLLIRQLGTCINATLDTMGCVTLQSIYNLALEQDNITFLKYVLGLLNSKLYDFIYSKASGDKQTFQRIILENIKQLPIPQSNSNQRKSIASLVDNILSAKRSNLQADTSALEKQIDTIVYNLFGLTPEEIALIEQS